jgi:hypothetical protein
VPLRSAISGEALRRTKRRVDESTPPTQWNEAYSSKVIFWVTTVYRVNMTPHRRCVATKQVIVGASQAVSADSS